MLLNLIASHSRLLHPASFRRLPESVNTIVNAPSFRENHSNVRPNAEDHCLPRVHAPALRLPDRQPNPASNVTVVTSEATSCIALKALVEVAERNKPVAWNIQSYRPHVTDDQPNQSPVVTMSAYAGDNVDFGNGPHLLVRSPHGEAEYMEQFKRYFQLNECQHVWYDYSASLNLLSTIDVRPNGLHRDVRNMAMMVNAEGNTRPKTECHSFESLVKQFLSPAFVSSIPASVVAHETGGFDHAPHPPAVPPADTSPQAQWVKVACDTAALVHAVHERLSSKLHCVDLHGFNSPPGYNRAVKTVLDSYDAFFRHVHRALVDIERVGVHVHVHALRDAERTVLDRMRAAESQFLEWARHQSEGAQFMKLHANADLRHFLFAPCRNSVDSTLAYPDTKMIKVPAASIVKPKKGSTEKKAKKREVQLGGMGIQPSAYMKSGWPSVSTSALESLVERVDSGPEDDKEGAQLCAALKILLEAKAHKRHATKIGKAVKLFGDSSERLSLRHSLDREHVGVHRAWTEARLGDDARGAISATEGNKLLVLKYQHLELWALAQLSGCKQLKRRVEGDHDMAAAGAACMYDGIGDEVRSGECVLGVAGEVEGGQADIDLLTVRQKHPVAYHMARKVDSAFKHGGGVGGVSRIRVITRFAQDKAQELRKRWYGGHGGVAQWHEEWREKSLSDGVVETMMGRRHKLASADKDKRLKWEAALTEGMKFVMHGTASEAVMGSVTQMVTNEHLHGLGWRVVLVDDATIVLEGPDYSLDMALPIIQVDATKPFGFSFGAQIKVVGEVVSSMNEVSSDSPR